VNYWEYIHVEDLLRLQGGVSDDERSLSNDEVLFVVVHQVYELWFKLVLRELTSARDLFDQAPVPDMAMANAVRSFRRVTTIFEQAQQHFRVMETMTTRDYLGFRDNLLGASGFQSAQLREIELLLGLDDASRISFGGEKTPPADAYKSALRGLDGSPSVALERLERRLADVAPREGSPAFPGARTIKEVLDAWIARTPIEGGAEAFLERVIASHREESERRVEIAVERMPHQPTDVVRQRFEAETKFAEAFLLGEEDPAASPEARAKKRAVRAGLVFLESYREEPRLTWPREVVDATIEMEQSMIVWRQRHARMVERVIGRRVGTGGSAGVDYLDRTALTYRIFGDMWAVRTLLLRKDAVPPLTTPSEYRFRVED
jgi:tryptophan 2,3-dioxygenase